MNAILLKHNSIRSYLLSSITSGSLRFSSFLLPSPKYQLSLISPSNFFSFSIRHGHSSKDIIPKVIPKSTSSSSALVTSPNIVSSSSANPHPTPFTNPSTVLVPFNNPPTALTTRISSTPSHHNSLSSENSKLAAGECTTFSRTKTRIENGDKTINDLDILMQLQYIQKNTAISNKEKELLLLRIQDYIHLLKKEKTLDIIIIDFLDNMQKQVSHLINSTNSQQLIDITPKIELQDLIVYSTIRDIVNNKNSTNTLTDQQLEHLLLFVQNLPETFIQSKESILSLLKQYFDSYPSTLTNSSLFLQLLHKHNLVTDKDIKRHLHSIQDIKETDRALKQNLLAEIRDYLQLHPTNMPNNFLLNELEKEEKRYKIHLEITNHLKNLGITLKDLEKTETTHDPILLNLLDEYFKNIPLIENNLALEMTDKTQLLNFFAEEKPPITKYTIDDYKYEIYNHKKALDIIKGDSAKEYNQSEILELARVAGIIKFSDAKDNQNNLEFKQSHGLTITEHCYNLISNNNENTIINNIIIKENKPTSSVIAEIRKRFKNKDFIVGKLTRKFLEELPNENNIVGLTGIDTHINVAVEDPENENYLYIIGYCTSTNNSKKTIKLSENQEATNKKDKAQYWRSSTKLIRVKKDEIEIIPNFDSFIKKNEILNIIDKDLEYKWILIENNHVELPIDFTFDFIKYLTILSFEKTIELNEQHIEQFYKQQKNVQDALEELRNKQKKNIAKTTLEHYLNKILSKTEKIYYEHKKKLEQMQKTKDKTSTEKTLQKDNINNIIIDMSEKIDE